MLRASTDRGPMEVRPPIAKTLNKAYRELMADGGDWFNLKGFARAVDAFTDVQEFPKQFLDEVYDLTNPDS